MSNRCGLWMTMVAVMVVMPLAPTHVAAQQQQQQPPRPYGRIATLNAACEEITNVRKKQHLTALPANVIEPKRTPEGWPDLQGTWSSGAYQVSGIHSIELGLDPAGFVIQCQDPASSTLVVETTENSCHEGERAVDTMVRAGLRARAAGLN